MEMEENRGKTVGKFSGIVQGPLPEIRGKFE